MPLLFVRHSRPVLFGTLILCAAWVAAIVALDGSDTAVEFVLEAGPLIAFGVLSWPSRRGGATRFMVHAGSFRMPQPGRDAAASLVALLMVNSSMAQGWGLLDDPQPHRATGGVALAVGMVTLAFIIATIWRAVGLELRPDGLIDRRALGTMHVPWEALQPGHPPRPRLDATSLPLSVDRPELVRRRDLRRGSGVSIDIRYIHPWFLADAIRFYTDNPHQRVLIGTAEGHEHLLQALTGARPGTLI